MKHQTIRMTYHPETGTSLPDTCYAKLWRKDNDGAWLNNPWTGSTRAPKDIGNDPYGYRIEDGYPPGDAILKAIRNGRPAMNILSLMDEIDCSIDERIGNCGDTVLTIAAYHGDADLVRALIRRGADPRAVSELQSASVLVFGSRHSAVLNVLRETDARLDVNYCVPADGFTPIMQALNIRSETSVFSDFDYNLVEERLECIRILFEMGADIDVQNAYGRTAIMSAAHTGEPRLVRALLKHNPDLDVVCCNGKRARDYAPSKEVKKLLSSLSVVSG
jgi:ankyrin repeat protein